MNKSAVVVRAGRRSTHQHWMTGVSPEFDLILVPYEPLSLESMQFATEVIPINGTKVAGWAELFHRRADLLGHYDYIALLDDDLLASASEINASFDMGRQFKLSLWQPSLSWDSYFSYAIFLKNPKFRLRYVNFIEMMCPFFTTSHLRRSLPLFSVGYETGVDRIWCRLQKTSHTAYAVLDDVVFHHTRPVGRDRSAQGFVGLNGDYQTVIDRMEKTIGLHFRGPVAYAGVTRDGNLIDSRLAMASLSVIPLLGWRESVNKGWFYRPILDHVRHNLMRPIDNDFIELETIINRLLASASYNTNRSLGR